ncbi:MAG: hypothetical protein ACJAXW_003174 [Candidatus Azotimanducaceae bacterium]|jgi:hypothetical protein
MARGKHLVKRPQGKPPNSFDRKLAALLDVYIARERIPRAQPANGTLLVSGMNDNIN